MKRQLLILLFLIYGMQSFAANDDSVKVHSDVMKFYGNENKTTFSGSVVAVSEKYTLTADNVDVYFTPQNDVKKIVCKGNVNFKTEEILAVASKAELNQATHMINMSGTVKIWQNENYLEGEKVKIQYITKEIHVDKGDKERVTIIFNPDNMSLP